MEIRKARIKDIPDIARLNHKVLLQHLAFDKNYYHYKKEQRKITSKYLKGCIYSKNETIFVAEDRRIIGYISGHITKRPPIFIIEKIGYLDTAIVEKDYRSKGIGQKLVDELVKWFIKKKIKHIELEVDLKNKSAISIWRNLGFENYRLKMKKHL